MCCSRTAARSASSLRAACSSSSSACWRSSLGHLIVPSSSLCHVGKSGTQCLVRPKQQRLYSRFGAVQHFRDLRVFHLFILVHQDCCSLFFRQHRDRPPDFRELRLIHHTLFYRGPGIRYLPYWHIGRVIVQPFLQPLVLSVPQRI